ncbi:MAG: Fatty acid hydroxylase family (carotene hydroxylase/sterol desaturase) [Nitrospira sp.]|jgi:sterol desaturase/sphingolipid hydroxylase (fatty acid hydroxylase superfamily)|nr:MAG: Fatty acid hydroxylase family (carotene hydroxylase/sterol desaturase) [Nitrospira sp.]
MGGERVKRLKIIGKTESVSVWSGRARRSGFILLSLAVLAAAAFTLCRGCDLQGLSAEVRFQLRAWVPDSLQYFIWTALNVWPGLLVKPFLDPYLYVVLGLLLTLERFFPARPQQETLSVGLVQDLVWFTLHGFLTVVVVSIVTSGLHALYQSHLSMLSIAAIQSWSLPAKIILVLMVNDFLDWFHHVVRHKVWVFWCFHAVHHSQREMNLFTDDRVHLIDEIVANCLVCIPMFMFAVDAPMALYFALLLKWYPKLYHANIKADLGILRYVLVTPQFHRIHHSIEPRHRDKNFGVIFSFWDRLFGTLHSDDGGYPATGIADPAFPLERNTTGIRVFSTYVAQFLYPFAAIYRRYWGPSTRT